MLLWQLKSQDSNLARWLYLRKRTNARNRRSVEKDKLIEGQKAKIIAGSGRKVNDGTIR